MKRFCVLVGVLGILAVMAPSMASAASSTCQGYSPQLCGSVTTSTSGTSSSTLPFTGLDVVLLVAGGGTLLGAGFVVRRLSRRLD
jgi:hypothetical protein